MYEEEDFPFVFHEINSALSGLIEDNTCWHLFKKQKKIRTQMNEYSTFRNVINC